MASGCAIVSSVPFGFDGALVSVGDVDAMVKSVGELWADAARCENAGRRNSAGAQRFSWDHAIDRLLTLYGEMIEQRH
jgi:hypothetical protein